MNNILLKVLVLAGLLFSLTACGGGGSGGSSSAANNPDPIVDNSPVSDSDPVVDNPGSGADDPSDGNPGPAVNNPPTNASANITTNEDSSGSTVPQVSDVDDTIHSFIIETQPQNGTAQVAGNTLVYTPNPNWNGSDSFTFRAVDGGGLFVVGTAQVTVSPVNDTPTTQDISSQDVEPEVAFTSTPQVSDPDQGDDYTISVAMAPQNGTVEVSSDGKSLLYTSNANFEGKDEITFLVTDSGNLTATAIAYFNVLPKVISPVMSQITTEAAWYLSPRVEVLGNKVALLWGKKTARYQADVYASFSFDDGLNFGPVEFAGGSFGWQFRTFIDDMSNLYWNFKQRPAIFRSLGFTGGNWQYVSVRTWTDAAWVNGSNIYAATGWENNTGILPKFAISNDEGVTWAIYRFGDNAGCVRFSISQSPVDGSIHMLYNCQTKGFYYVKYSQGVVSQPIKIAEAYTDGTQSVHAVRDKIYFINSCMYFPRKESNGSIHVLKSCDDGLSWEDIFVSDMFRANLTLFKEDGTILVSYVPQKVWMDSSTMTIYAFEESEARNGYLVFKAYRHDALNGTWNQKGESITDLFDSLNIDIREDYGVEQRYVEIGSALRFADLDMEMSETDLHFLYSSGGDTGNIFYFKVPLKSK